MTTAGTTYPQEGFASHAAPARGFMEAVRYCFSNYVNFSGRASRSEFWYFVLFNILVNIVLSFVDAAVFNRLGETAILPNLYTLAVLLPTLGVGARRLHDIGRTGWWQLVALVPLIGTIVLIVFWAKPGQTEPNGHG